MGRNTDGVTWQDLLVRMAVLNIEAVDRFPSIFPPTLAGIAASPEQVAEAEARLGHSLDPLHAELLRAGNGWPHTLLTDGTLFATDDLGGSELWNRAVEGIKIAYDELADQLPPRHEVYPIASFPFDRHIVAVWQGGPLTDGGHPVLWFDGGVTEQWDNIWEWWLSMLASRKRTIETISKYLEGQEP